MQVTKILGDAHAHLYPAILQLVMADGVWTEGKITTVNSQHTADRAASGWYRLLTSCVD